MDDTYAKVEKGYIAAATVFLGAQPPRLVRLGVDPASGGSLRMTSDEFFADPRFREARFDVVFIDGMHEGQQALRDAENALGRLRPGGFITMHDMAPPKEQAALWPQPSFMSDELLEWAGGEAAHVDAYLRPVNLSGSHHETGSGWNGDTWRAAASLMTRTDTRFAIALCDEGVGILTRRGTPLASAPVSLPAPALPRTRTLGLDGRFEAVGGETPAERMAKETTARRQLEPWARRSGGVAVEHAAMRLWRASGPLSGSLCLEEGEDAWSGGTVAAGASSDGVFDVVGALEKGANLTDAFRMAGWDGREEEVEEDGEAAEEKEEAKGPRPLLRTHPAVRCVRGLLGQESDDLREKGRVVDHTGANSGLLSWEAWKGGLLSRVEWLNPEGVHLWAEAAEEDAAEGG